MSTTSADNTSPSTSPTSTSPNNKGLEQSFANVSTAHAGKLENPFPLYKEKRHNEPVMKGDILAELGVPSIAAKDASTPVFSVFKHQDVMEVLRDDATYTSGFILKGLGAFLDGLILTGLDGEEHRKMRTLLAPAFTPGAVNKWRGILDKIMREEFVGPLVPLKKADLGEMALMFPIRIIYAVIGFPNDDPAMIKQFAAWGLDILGGPQRDPEAAKAAGQRAMAASEALYQAMKPLVALRRANLKDTDNDLISLLIRAELDGRHLDDHEITTFIRSLLPAASETTTRTFGTALLLLLQRPALLDRVRADRKLISRVTDEAVRYDPTAAFKLRQTSKEVEIRGVQIPAGAMIECSVSSAGRDEEVFENSDEFDIDREKKPHFGFGYGPHMCVGIHVAKAEIESALNALFDLLPNLRLDPAQPMPVIAGANLRGPKTIPVVWD